MANEFDLLQINDLITAAVDSGITHDHLESATNAIPELHSNIAPAKITNNYAIRIAIHNAVVAASQHHVAELFLAQLVALAPRNKRLLSLTTSLIVVSDAERKRFEDVSRLEVCLTSEPFGEPLKLARAIQAQVRRVCTVTAEDGAGTGFLVGARTVMTAGHVVRTARSVTCLFDFVEDGKPQLRPGTVRIQRQPRFDLAMIELDSAVGHEEIDGSRRGWLDVSKPSQPMVGHKVIILQHPEDASASGLQRMRISLGAVQSIDGGIVTHNANTARGSSGSPVFDHNLSVLGVHLAAGNMGLLLASVPYELRSLSGPQEAAQPLSAGEARPVVAVKRLQVPELIGQLDQIIECEPAFSRGFLHESPPWSLAQVKIVAPDYFAFVRHFPRCLARLIGNVDDEPSRIYLTSILHEELGEGNPERVHHRLFSNLLTNLGLSLEDIDSQTNRETERHRNELERLYGHNDILVALGAQYALEKQAQRMLGGVRRGFSHVLVREEEYFTVHERQEPEHHQRMMECLNSHIGSRKDLDRVIAGARQLMDSLNGFWQGIEKNLSRTAHQGASAQSSESPEVNTLLAFENELLSFLVNILSPQPNVKLDRLSALGTFVHTSPTATSAALDGILEACALSMEPAFRIYLAIPLAPIEASVKYLLAKSYSVNDPGWMSGTTVTKNSNIAYVFSSQISRCHADTALANQRDNMPALDERCVANYPVIVNHQTFAVLGISSPTARSIDHRRNATPAASTMYEFGQRLALHLAVLIGCHLERSRDDGAALREAIVSEAFPRQS
jgi:pyrroloquinoline-quinone synthase